MSIFMTGGTGFVGKILAGGLTEQGHKVTVLTRAIRSDPAWPPGVTYLEGDPAQRGRWQESVAAHRIIINLAGASIFTRWTARTKERIRESRVLTTRNLVEALSTREGKETVLLSTSAIGYYGFHGDEELGEGASSGDDFLSSVVREWEAAALAAEKFGVRVLLCRYGMVLGRGGGALEKVLPLFKSGLGSPLGSGRQWVSWIHERDLVNIYLHLINRTDMFGPVNCTAPEPVRNREMTHILGQVLHRPTFMPSVPAFLLRLRLGEFSSVLLNGQKVLPEKLLQERFHFQFSNLRDALIDLLGVK